MRYEMKYDLESDIEALEGAGHSILSYTKTRNGHVILWFDALGYTVTVRENRNSSVGGVLMFDTAKEEYINRIQELMQ